MIALRLVRRRFLASAGLLALTVPTVAKSHPAGRGGPFSDGSLFVDDGTGLGGPSADGTGQGSSTRRRWWPMGSGA